jgi:hypothetical protein
MTKTTELIIALAIAGAALVSGCGDNSGDGSPTSTAAGTPSRASGPLASCPSVDLATVTQCLLPAGPWIFVAHRNEPLRLRTLGAQVSATAVRRIVTGPFRGEGLVTVALRVTNFTETPRFFDRAHDQTTLQMAGAYHHELTGVDRFNAQQIMNTGGVPIAPGSSVRWRVSFRLPLGRAQSLRAHPRAGLYVANFGESVAGGPRRSGSGYITLRGT